jgi:hypothetical protein
MRAYLRSKDIYKVCTGKVHPADKKRHKTASILISHLGDAVFDSVITANNEDKPDLIWTAITQRFASSSVNNKARVWLKFMRYKYPGNLKGYINTCRKMINKFVVIQLGIPDDIISISILAKLSREHWNVVANIIMNEAVVFYPNLTLKKLQELVFMKYICSDSTATTTTSSISKADSKITNLVTALKADVACETVQLPCLPGYHNQKATHKEWKCLKLSDKKRIAARPDKGEANTAAPASQQPESDYVKVSAFLNFGPKPYKCINLDSGASHHMVNNPAIFKKLKEVNIEINTGNKKQHVKAVAMEEVTINDDNRHPINLSDVLLTPDLTRSLISLDRLFSKSTVITKTNSSFVIKLDNKTSFSSFISNNLWELTSKFANNPIIRICLLP